MCKLDSTGSIQYPVTIYSEHSNAPLCSIRVGEYLCLLWRQPCTECLLHEIKCHSRVFSPSLGFTVCVCAHLFPSEVLFYIRSFHSFCLRTGFFQAPCEVVLPISIIWNLHPFSLFGVKVCYCCLTIFLRYVYPIVMLVTYTWIPVLSSCNLSYNYFQCHLKYLIVEFPSSSLIIFHCFYSTFRT